MTLPTPIPPALHTSGAGGSIVGTLISLFAILAKGWATALARAYPDRLRASSLTAVGNGSFSCILMLCCLLPLLRNLQDVLEAVQREHPDSSCVLSISNADDEKWIRYFPRQQQELLAAIEDGFQLVQLRRS